MLQVFLIHVKRLQIKFVLAKSNSLNGVIFFRMITLPICRFIASPVGLIRISNKFFFKITFFVIYKYLTALYYDTHLNLFVTLNPGSVNGLNHW